MSSSKKFKKKALQIEGYKILVTMLQNDDNLFWTRNNVLIAINGGMLTVLGFIQNLTTKQSLQAISIAICIMGTVVGFVWFIINKRGEAFYNIWYIQLKYFERQYLKPINIFQITEKYFSKGEIIIGKEPFKLDLISRIRMFLAMQILSLFISFIWLFLGLYLAFLIY